ncbi:hypothetical protein BASA50_011227 [Batrachochytrium salamandrivorans]|uniref:Vacuolar sorting protein Vps3844 C-terminal domain-containing protein n=1 Tax=Batrachochytrium salamandrivorans TaxID=1357716 RepID=A0ABQ8EW15_9FUNG|nr:hypothetical protein BASA61_009997 [Batrachochytrium salamandrivorans]KAH6587624.1 hypothetical protein BASA50_011227 [Batrachochytrium salamandrivorans]KAJ1336831.1 hypothetical protein BSLG_006934 [Batrachochytrium salamandrivorans]
MQLATLVVTLAAALVPLTIATASSSYDQKPHEDVYLSINGILPAESQSLLWTDVQGLLLGIETHIPYHALALQQTQLKLQMQEEEPFNGEVSGFQVFPVSSSPFHYLPLATIFDQRPGQEAMSPAYHLPASSKDFEEIMVNLMKTSTSEHRVFQMGSLGTVQYESNEVNSEELSRLRQDLCGGDCELENDLEFLTESAQLQRMISLVQKQAPKAERLAIHLVALAHAKDTESRLKKAIEIQAKLLDEFKLAFRSALGENSVIAHFSVPFSLKFVEQAAASDSHVLQKRAVQLACSSSISECQTRFSNCSNHGVCVGKKNPAQPSSQCFVCSCTVNKWTDDNGNRVPNYDGDVTWGGDSCQYQDVSVSFQILFWFTVGGIAVMIYVISLLYSIGDSSSNSGGAPTSRPKVD